MRAYTAIDQLMIQERSQGGGGVNNTLSDRPLGPYKRTLLLYAFAALAVYFITAWHSIGYYQADEHFQLLEFASYKAGNEQTPLYSLAWEYEARIRSGVQVFLAWTVIKVFHNIGVTDPFAVATFLRSCSAFLSLFTLGLLYRACSPLLTTRRAHHIFLSCVAFLWFMPFLAVRFSSETWSACFFFIGLSWFLLEPSNRSIGQRICIGILLGLSFNFRFQAAFLITGFMLWLWIEHKEWNKAGSYLILLGILMSVIVAAVADRWLYGEWTFTAWNYARTALLEGRGADYGIAPWHYYFGKILEKGNPLIGLLTMVAFLVFWWRFRRHAFTWAGLAFVLIHILVPHKEFRFLFSLFLLAPVAIALLLQMPVMRFSGKHWVLGLVLAFNLPYLVHVMISPASENVLALRYAYQEREDPGSALFYTGINPYDPWGREHTFYRPRNSYEVIEMNVVDDLQQHIRTGGFYFSGTLGLPHPRSLPGLQVELLHQTYPYPVTRYLNFNNWVERTSMRALYRVERE